MEYNYELPKAVVGWIYNHARKNYWRVASWYEIDDLIHDGLVCAYKCKDRYGDDLDGPHFMGLVKTSFHHLICDLIRRKRAVDDPSVYIERFNPVSESQTHAPPGEISENSLELSVAGNQEYAALINELPDPIRSVVLLLINDPKKMRLSKRVRLEGKNESLSNRLYRLVGFPKHLNWETELRSYLWEREHDLV